MQVNLLQGEFLDLFAILRTADFVLGGHLRILGLNGDGLRGINAHIDDLVGDSQTVEFRGCGAFFAEGEIALVAQFHGVEDVDAFETHVLEIEHGVGGIADLSFHIEFLMTARCRDERTDSYNGYEKEPFKSLPHFEYV